MNNNPISWRVLVCLMFATIVAVPLPQAAIWKIHGGASQAQIQAVIDSASAGDTISFGPGTYKFTSALALKSGIVIEGNGCTWHGDNPTNIVKVIDASSLSNVTVKDLETDNVMFRLWGASNASSVNNITFTGITFRNGRAEAGLAQIDSRYLQFKATQVTVSGCRFLRKETYPGKCLHLYRAEDVNFINNLVGTTNSHHPNPWVHGYFKTVINMNSDSVTGGVVNATISDNLIYRSVLMADDSSNSDHGIYAHGFNSLLVQDNIISGWPATATGGAIKIRNGQNAIISNNLFLRSGILMYVYRTGYYKYLKNVDVTDNVIIQDSWDGIPSIHKGIGFWRDYATTAQAEYSIYINNNKITRGCINIAANTHAADFNADGGGVFNNTINTGAIAIPGAIDQSGNSVNP